MALEWGFRQIIKITGTSLAPVFLAARLFVIHTILDDLRRIAVWTTHHSIRPPHVTNRLEAACLIDQGMDIQKIVTTEGWLAHEYSSWT